MLSIIVYCILFSLVWSYLRSKLIQRKPLLPENFTPDYGKANKKFGKMREERRKRWEKKQEEELKNVMHESILDLFDKEMEYIEFKKEYERKNPLRQRSMYEGALDLYEISKKQRERKIFLAKKKKEIFAKHDKMKKNKTNSNSAENEKQGPEEPKNDSCKEKRSET